MEKIEGLIQHDNPKEKPDVTIVDAMFLLHIIQNIPETFGGLAQLVIIMLCQMSTKHTDFVCDT